MPKKNEPTATPVTQDSKKPAKAEKPAAPSAPKAAAKPAEAKPAKTTAKAAEKPAAAPKTEKKPASSAKKSAKPSVTVVVAKYDVGHGNSLFIRGEGGGLSWEKGALMENAGNDVWVWTTDAALKGNVSFKFLINDEGWCAGENMTAKAGETTTLYPAF